MYSFGARDEVEWSVFVRIQRAKVKRYREKKREKDETYFLFGCEKTKEQLMISEY